MSSILLPDSGWQVEIKDHGKLSMDEVLDWTVLQASLSEATQPEKLLKFREMYPYIAGMIESWNVPELSATDPASIGRLSFDDVATLQEETYAAATRRQKDIKNSVRPST